MEVSLDKAFFYFSYFSHVYENYVMYCYKMFCITVYKLIAFISHMGSSSTVGHYVCHIKKEGRWVIFNDEKVAVSQNPPTDLGYLYIYERKNC